MATDIKMANPSRRTAAIRELKDIIGMLEDWRPTKADDKKASELTQRVCDLYSTVTETLYS